MVAKVVERLPRCSPKTCESDQVRRRRVGGLIEIQGFPYAFCSRVVVVAEGGFNLVRLTSRLRGRIDQSPEQLHKHVPMHPPRMPNWLVRVERQDRNGQVSIPPWSGHLV